MPTPKQVTHYRDTIFCKQFNLDKIKGARVSSDGDSVTCLECIQERINFHHLEADVWVYRRGVVEKMNGSKREIK